MSTEIESWLQHATTEQVVERIVVAERGSLLLRILLALNVVPQDAVATLAAVVDAIEHVQAGRPVQ